MSVLTYDLADEGLSSEVLSGLIGSSPDLIQITDHRDVVVYASGATHELLGCGPDEVKGRSLSEISHPQDAGVIVRATRQALATGRSVRRLHRARQHDGHYRWLETTVRGLNTSRGRFAVLVSREASGRQAVPIPLPGLEVTPPAANGGLARPDNSDVGDLARQLTDRECEVLRGLGQGLSVSCLAEQLHLQESTLRGHVKSILAKLQVHSQLQAVLVGMRSGIVPEVTSGADPADG